MNPGKAKSKRESGGEAERRVAGVKALKLPNVRRFLWFRLFFNGRFYYPVFTVLFLDYGLTLAQFSILNAIWAATIVLGEVPSGALADRVGRKRLVVFAAVSMVVEMALIAFLPTGNAGLVFTVFALNRILSGLAEAAASGADEALAYDTLKAKGLEQQWGRVLESAMRLQAVAFIFAMGLGAMVFDNTLVNSIVGWFWEGVELPRNLTMRLPIFLTLLTAFGAVICAVGMDEKASAREETTHPWRDTLGAGGWILRTRPVWVLLFFGVLFDSFNRQFVTLASEYYRTIQFPDWSFGLIGAFSALNGIFLPRVARWMVEHLTRRTIALIMGGWTLVGFLGIALTIPGWGLAFAIMAFSTMSANGFFLSHYLNEMADSRIRATVLSFRGLSLNLAYGMISLGYGALAASIAGRDGMDGEAVFVETLGWFGPVFGISFVALVLFVVGRRASE